MKNPKIVFNLLFLLFVFSQSKLQSFDTFKDISDYAKATPEYPAIDNQDYLKPDFSSFYKKATTGTINRLISKAFNFLKIKKESWSVEKFESLLQKATEQQEKSFPKGEYIIKITPTDKTDFVVFGDIQGAFHSLERDLIKLKTAGYIDENLKIIKQNLYFIFNGNAIGNSAYIMETLSVITSLMEKNSGKVFYNRGEQEIKEGWKNFGLQQQLKIQAKHLSKEGIPLEALINKFLDTLPLAVYIKIPSDKIPKFIRISYFDRTYTPLYEKSFSNFLQQQSDKFINTFEFVNKKQEKEQPINIEAIIEGKDLSLQFQKIDGLKLLLPDKGTTAWTMLSCPTLSFQKTYDFFNDAFAILSVDPQTKNCFITAYRQHAIEQKGFTTKTYNILTEEEIIPVAPKVEEIKIEKKEEKVVVPSKREIKIGANVDISGILASETNPTLEGVLISLRQENKLSNINNIILIAQDNKSKKDLIVFNTEKLLKDGINIFLQNMGSSIVETMLPLIKYKPIFMLCGATSPIFRKAELKNFVNYFPSSFQSTQDLTNYIIKNLDKKRLAFIYQNETYGQGAYEGFLAVVKKYNLQKDTDWIEFSYKIDEAVNPNDASVIQKFKPEAIIAATYDSTLKEFIYQLESNFLLNRTIGVIEASNELKNFLSKRNMAILSTQIIPDLQRSDLEIVTEYKKQPDSKKTDTNAMEGYIGASILTYLINKVEGEVTPKKLLQAAESVKNQNFKGLNLNFDPNTRSILDDVWIDPGDGKPFIYKEAETEKAPISANKEDFKVGTILDLSATNAVWGKAIVKGLNLNIIKANREGGINGRIIKLIPFDDKSTPQLAKENSENLLKKEINIILHPLGNSSIESYLPLAKENKIAIVFSASNSTSLYKPEPKNMTSFYPSSKDLGKVITEYAIKELKLDKFVVFYQTENYSKSGFEGATEIFQKYNLIEGKNWIAVSHQPNSIDFAQAINKIKEFSPKAILLFSVYLAHRTVIEQLGIEFLHNKILLGLESDGKIINLIRKDNLQFATAQLLPNPDSKDLQIAQEYRNETKEELNDTEFGAYLACDIFVDILRKIQEPITKEKIIEAIEQIKDRNFKGINITFNPSTRAIIKEVFINNLRGEILPFSIPTTDQKVPVQTPQSISANKENFVVGNSMDLSKGGAHWGRADLRGIVLSINKTNRQGGINGRKMHLINYDDKDDPETALSNVEALIKKNIDFIIHPFGSLLIQKYLPLLKENKIAVIFSASSDEKLYKPEPKNLVNFFLSSKETAKTITEYAIKELKLRKFAIFYELEPYSQSALEGSIEIFKKFNLIEGKDWIMESHQQNVLDISSSVNKIREFSPQGILLFSVYQANTSLLDQLGAAFLSEKIILPLESDGKIIDAVKKRNLKFATTQTLPSTDSENIEIAKQFKEELEIAKKEGSGGTTELLDTTFSAFVATELFVDIVKNLQEPITKEKVIDAIEKIKNRDFRGIKINFDPEKRTVLNNCYIYTTEGKVIPYEVTAPTTLPAAAPTPPTPAPAAQPIAKNENEIKVGVTLDQNRKTDETIKAIALGLKTRIAKKNSKGGINVKKII